MTGELAREWRSITAGLSGHATVMANLLSDEFAELIHRTVGRVCEQPAPANAKVIVWRRAQVDAARTIIRAVSHANSMGRISTGAASEILKITQRFADRPVPTTQGDLNCLAKEDRELRSDISSICHAESIRRLRVAASR